MLTPSKGWPMAGTMRETAGARHAADFPRPSVAALSVAGMGGGNGSASDIDARSMASVGLAALIGLPLLMLASVVLDAPLAAPAAIACFYLAIASALAARREKRAAALSAAVVCGLVGWSLSFMLTLDGPPSAAGLAAALLAPLFAAAPAMARLVIAPKSNSRVGAIRAKDAGMRSGLAADRRSERIDEALAAEADARAGYAQADIEVVRTRRLERGTAGRACDKIVHAPSRDVMFTSDVRDALNFALRHAAAKAEGRCVTLSSEVDDDLAAACDRQTCRRILHLAIDSVVSVARGAVHVSARRSRGVVLIRVECDCTAEPDAGALDVARATVEKAGGTLLMERQGEGVRTSIRLDLANVRVENASKRESTGVHRVAC